MRHILAIGAAAALLGMGGSPASQPLDEDDEDVRKWREAQRLKHEEQMRALEKSRSERQKRIRAAVELEERSERMLAAGLDPTNGNPLSRQQRRAMQRRRGATA